MQTGSKVIIDNRKYTQSKDGRSRLKLYEDLPLSAKGTVVNYYDKSSKISVRVEGYTNKKSRYGCFYFPRNQVVEDQTQVQEFKKALWALYRTTSTVSQAMDLLQEISEWNTKAFRQKMLFL